MAVPEETPVQAIRWLEFQFDELGTGTSFQNAEAANLEIPETPEQAIEAIAQIERVLETIREDVVRFQRLMTELDQKVEQLYRAKIGGKPEIRTSAKS